MPPAAATRRILLALLLLFPSLALAADYDRWYALEMSGSRAGWMHNTQTTSGDRITTKNELKFELGRSDAALSVSIQTEFVETAAGKPISLKAVQRLGATPTTMEATYGDKDIAIAISQSGSTKNSTRPLPDGQWLTPAAANEFVRQRLTAGAETIVVRSVDPAGGTDPTAMLRPSTITHKDCRKATIKAMGKDIPVTRCITTTDSQAGVESTEYLDEQGIPVRSETSLGGFQLVAVAVDRTEATAHKPAPEMMVSTFVRPDRKIERPRTTTSATYLLSVPDGKLPELPSAAAQHFQPISERRAELRIDAVHSTSAPEADTTNAAFTDRSSMIDSADDTIKDLAAQATRNAGPDKAKRAEAMRRFVHRYITHKDLGVGFATASETARTRQGDCTEHGVLLAALLRADGIPSRVACGLVYADHFAGASDIFGYHMWTQALLDVDGKPCWVDLDATLSQTTPFDATHIALALSPMADGDSQDALLAIATIIGRLQIKVESAQ